MVIPEKESFTESPVLDPAKPDITEESAPVTPRMQLFFVLRAVQTVSVWVLMNFGCSQPH